ncbi:MAG: sugar ABC transporter substrate-binding protein [Chloroflexi bacterium]|nr:sugar ABC transporter substrate-binding protein [Chloroflexota bacterium]
MRLLVHSRRLATSLLASLLSFGVLLGPASLATHAQQTTSIRFWYMPNGGDPTGALQAEIDGFNQVHPEVSIDAEQVDWGSAFTRIQTAIQGGDGPCLTQLGTTWVPGFSAMGGLRPFTQDEVSAMGGPSNFVNASWATSSLAGSGQVTAVPWFADVRALAYRKDILAQTGLSAEDAFKDWTSFENTLMKVKQTSPDVAPFVHPGKNDWNVWQNGAMWIWGAGGDLLNPGYTQAVFNSDDAVRGVTEFASLYSKGLTSSDTLELNSNQTDSKFGDGKAFSIISGPWNISNARTPVDKGGWSNDVARQNLAFAQFPAGPGGNYTFVGGSNLAILNNCPNPDAAVAFVEYLTSNESQVRYAQTIGMLPAVNSAQHDPAFSADPNYRVFMVAAANGKTSAPIAQWGQVEPTLQEQLQAVWDDVANLPAGKQISAEQVKSRLDAAAKAVNAYLRS